ncbi:hypothetical protein ACJX0J_035443 [Zea mays]
MRQILIFEIYWTDDTYSFVRPTCRNKCAEEEMNQMLKHISNDMFGKLTSIGKPSGIEESTESISGGFFPLKPNVMPLTIGKAKGSFWYEPVFQMIICNMLNGHIVTYTLVTCIRNYI